jgi:hypothetical protein
MRLCGLARRSYTRARLKRHRAVAQCLVALLVVCLLRAMMPVEQLAASSPSEPSAGFGVRDYPCAGHDCACGDREHCLAACCCFPHERSAVDVARFDARRSAQLSPTVERVHRDARTALVRARRCDGGTQRPSPSAPSIVSLEPSLIEWPALAGGAPLRAAADHGALEHLRPDPPTPPPRRIASAV